MLKSLFLLLQNLVTTKTQLILENIFLHKQLEIYQRTDPKLNIKRTDRMFFSLMMDWLSNWKERIFIVKPDSVIKWHRTAFKFYWRWKAQQKGGRENLFQECISYPDFCTLVFGGAFCIIPVVGVSP